MLGRRLYIAGLGILLASMTPAVPFTNHFIRMDEVMIGAFGDPDVQFVEMAFNCGQNLWGPENFGGPPARARLAFFDENDIETGEFLFPNNPPCSANNKALIATQAFADLPSAPTPDFIMPAGIAPTSGKVCFRDNPDSPFAFDVVLCLSYGDFIGNSEQGSVGNAPSPFSGCSLRKDDGGFFGEPNFNDDFQLSTPDPENNSGSIGALSSFCDPTTAILGDLGIGTDTPSSSLHIQRDDSSAEITVEESSTTVANRTMFFMRNNGGAAFELVNENLGTTWRFNNHNPSGEFRVSLAGSGQQEMKVDPAGNLGVAGTVTQMSSRDAKENFQQIDPMEILSKVAEMPLMSWNYKSDGPEVRHLGPMGESFYEAFRLGKDGKGISVTDTAGVSLASIQALNSIIDRLLKEKAELKAQNAAILMRLAALEATVRPELEE